MGKAADNELFIITDTPTFSLKIGNVTYDGTSNVSAVAATESASGLMSASDKKNLMELRMVRIRQLWIPLCLHQARIQSKTRLLNLHSTGNYLHPVVL